MQTQDIERDLKRIAEAKKNGSIIIYLCNAEHLPELHRLIVEEVQIETEGDRDLYEPTKGNKKVTLHLSALERLGTAAGIEWIHEATCMKAMEHHPDGAKCHYIATGFFAREFNRRVSMQGEGYIDLAQVKRELEIRYTEKAKKGRWDPDYDNGPGRKPGRYVRWDSPDKEREYIRYCVDRDYIPKEKKIIQLARAEATAQVYRKLLGLGAAYPRAVFQRPIVIVRCVVAVDLKDPDTMKILRENAIPAHMAIYGNQPQALPMPTPHYGDYSGNEATIDIPDAEENGEEEPEIPDSQMVDFENSEIEDQIDVINDLIGDTGYDLDPRHDLYRMRQERRNELFKKLLSLPKIEEDLEDDIPF